MGTALIARGLDPARERAPAWNLTRPEEVLAVHRAHVAAGAELVLTNTFVGCSPEEAAAALRLARESGARFVGGSLWAGLADLPQQLAQLSGADCLWLESATSSDQALRAVALACAASDKPVVIGCSLPLAPLERLRKAGAAAAGYNCTPRPLDPGSADFLKPAAEGLSPEGWAQKVPRVRLAGGCCGTDARYLAALRATAR